MKRLDLSSPSLTLGNLSVHIEGVTMCDLIQWHYSCVLKTTGCCNLFIIKRIEFIWMLDYTQKSAKNTK